MKAEQITLNGKNYYLVFNGVAKFAIDELCGEQLIWDLILPGTSEAHSYLCKAVSILAEQGELVRRYYGYDHGEMLAAEEALLFIKPDDISSLKLALNKAIARGYGREIEDDEKEVDLVLQEIQKKTVKR